MVYTSCVDKEHLRATTEVFALSIHLLGGNEMDVSPVSARCLTNSKNLWQNTILALAKVDADYMESPILARKTLVPPYQKHH